MAYPAEYGFDVFATQKQGRQRTLKLEESVPYFHHGEEISCGRIQGLVAKIVAANRWRESQSMYGSDPTKTHVWAITVNRSLTVQAIRLPFSRTPTGHRFRGAQMLTKLTYDLPLAIAEASELHVVVSAFRDSGVLLIVPQGMVLPRATRHLALVESPANREHAAGVDIQLCGGKGFDKIDSQFSDADFKLLFPNFVPQKTRRAVKPKPKPFVAQYVACE